MTPNHLDWPDCRNARDVGGMPVSDGGAIRTGALIRTDSLHRLTPDGVDVVRSYGPTRIIDLRRHRETSVEPSPFAADPIYRSVPVQNPVDPDHEWLTLADIYITMLDLRPTLFAQAVGAIADAPDGPVIVHCAGGKDRTGIVVGLALAIAGVETDPIAADYALTEERTRDVDEAALAAIEDPEVRERVARLTPTPPENMVKVLDHLVSTYGGVASYLMDKGGLTTEQLGALRARLVAL